MPNASSLRCLLSLALCAVVACVAPAPSFDAYEAKAVDAAEAVASEAETAILVAVLARRDRWFGPTVSVQLQEAETAARQATGTFSSIQPPDRASDRLRERLLPLLERASEVIAKMRIAARRGDVRALVHARRPLAERADALDRFADRHG